MWKAILAIVIVGVLVAAGFWVYQFGYRNGVAAANAGEGYPRRLFGFFWNGDDGYHMPFGGHHGMFSDEDGGLVMPFHQQFEYPYNQRFNFQDRFPVARTFLSPFWFFMKLVVFGVLLWLIYKVMTLFTRGKGWQLSFHSIEDGDEKGKKK
jgi:hypothetical protein